MLRNRQDMNCDIPYHDEVWSKAARMGNGAIAPLSQALRDQMELGKRQTDSSGSRSVSLPQIR